MIRAVGAVWANPYVRVVLLVMGAVLLFVVLRQTRLVWGSILLAVLFAYLLTPLVDAIERRGYHRGLGVAAVGLLFLLALAGFALLGIAVATQLSGLASEVPELVQTLWELPFRLARLVDPSFGNVFQQVFMASHQVADGLVREVVPSIEGLGAGGVTDGLASLAEFGTRIAVVLVLSLYLLYRFPGYAQSLFEAFPERHRPFAREMASKVDFSLGGFLRGQVVIAAFVGVLTGIGLTIVGVPLSLVLGVLAAIFNLIPFFGPLLVSIPTALLAMTGGFGQVVAALLVLLAVNVLDGNILTPLIYSRTIALDPITIIVAILFGAALFGLVGAILAVPVAAFLKLVYLDYYLPSRWYQRGAEDRTGT